MATMCPTTIAVDLHTIASYSCGTPAIVHMRPTIGMVCQKLFHAKNVTAATGLFNTHKSYSMLAYKIHTRDSADFTVGVLKKLGAGTHVSDVGSNKFLWATYGEFDSPTEPYCAKNLQPPCVPPSPFALPIQSLDLHVRFRL